MHGRRYSRLWSASLGAVAFDIFAIINTSTQLVRVVSLSLVQHSVAMDANAALARVRFTYYTGANGSGGITGAGNGLQAGMGSSNATLRWRDTTQALGATVITYEDVIEVRHGLVYRPPPEERIVLSPSQKWVARLGSAGSTLTWDAEIVFEEMGT